jgi:hypothetical protein
VGAALSELRRVFIMIRRASFGLRALPLIAPLIHSFNFIPSYAMRTSTPRSAKAILQ